MEYLAHNETPPPLGPPQGLRHSLSVRSWGRVVSYEQGTPVRFTLSAPTERNE